MNSSSLGILLLALVAGGLGAPLPEETTLLVAGALTHRSSHSLPFVIAACGAAVLAADLILFAAARYWGPRVLRWRWLSGLLSESRRQWVVAQVARYGAAAVFVARFLPGVRVLVFLTAGLHGMDARRFILFDLLGLCVTVPVLVLLGTTVSTQLDHVLARVHEAQLWALLLAVGVGLGLWAHFANRVRS